MLDGGVDRNQYSEGRSSLEGRAMFVTSSEGRDDAAVIAVDGPVGGFDRIQNLVALGYLIRTRADTLDDAQAGDTTRRDAALASGAQVISTDYPVEEILGNGYFVEIPGGMPSGCNPITTANIDFIRPRSRKSTLPSPLRSASGSALKKTDFKRPRSRKSTIPSSSRSASQRFP